MSSLVSTVVILGALGAAAYVLINRCQILGMCDSGDVSSSDTGGDGSDTLPGDSATFKADKGKRCGCCKCTRESSSVIRCITKYGDTFHFQNGLSIDAQCKACASSASTCPDDAAKISQNAAKNVTTSAPKDTYKYTCASGYHPNIHGVCVSDSISSKKENKAKGDSTQGGCPAGHLQTCTYNSTLDKIVCKCLGKAMYTRTYYSDAGIPRNPFRSHLSYI